MPTMPSGGQRLLESPADEAILIDLTPPETEHVHPARSRWTALFIAVFTGLTCLGLTASTVVPRLIDRAADRGDQPSRVVQTVSTTTGSTPAIPPNGRSSIVEAKPVVATARVATSHGAPVVIRVTGAAAAAVGTVEVTLRLRGRAVATEIDVLDTNATFPGTIGAVQVGIVSWTVDLLVPGDATPGGGDDRAIVEISWGSSGAAPAGSDVLVVSLGDGRAHV